MVAQTGPRVSATALQSCRSCLALFTDEKKIKKSRRAAREIEKLTNQKAQKMDSSAPAGQADPYSMQQMQYAGTARPPVEPPGRIPSVPAYFQSSGASRKRVSFIIFPRF